MTLALTALDPRRRLHGVASVPSSVEDYEQARDAVADAIAQGRSTSRTDLVAELAGMDMAIHSVTRETGEQFLWSRRDVIARAAVRGDLSAEEFAAFLEAMGEKVVWPEP